MSQHIDSRTFLKGRKVYLNFQSLKEFTLIWVKQDKYQTAYICLCGFSYLRSEEMGLLNENSNTP